ncbi:SPOR domain-containing protein [Pedobacter frigoris]|uniref:HU domain-containing protein n=1 Tax=Pedobacter frigoris TaxID=2571272 RepID=UPI00292D3916|nr:SPOR domain-containing protein [Pedobacter frigoris]
MEILSYLTELVKTRKEVGIPGVGTFYKKKSPGRYDADTHSFLPPSYTLDFTLEVREHESLASYVSLQKNISFESASYHVDQFSETIQKHLSEHKTADFAEIGKLSIKDNHLVFDAKGESNIGFESYGLPSFKEEINEPFADHQTADDIPQVTEEQLILEDHNADLSDGSGNFDETHHEEKDIDEQETYEEISEIKPEVQSIIPTPSALIETPEGLDDTEEESKKPFYTTSADPGSVWTFNQNSTSSPKKETITEEPVENNDTKPTSYLKIILALAGVILLVLIALYFFKPEVFKGVTEKKPDHSVDSTSNKKIEGLKRDSLASVDSLKKIIPPTNTLKDSVKAISVPIDTAISYEIIAASLLNKKEADRFLQDMKRKGIPAKVADMPGKRVKISIGTFTDEVTAKNELERLRETTKIPGIYIYPIKHTHKP